MAIVKDNSVYRTPLEQLQHLTDAHVKQLEINQNVSEQLENLTTVSNYGGYNLVRFAFTKKGTYYKLNSEELTVSLERSVDGQEAGDFVEINAENAYSIPAYGFIKSLSGTAVTISIEFSGDFLNKWSTLRLINTTKGKDCGHVSISASLYSEFDGTSLLDYDANERKRQLFNVMEDLTYNEATQYVSFDINQDGTYSFVFVGINPRKQDGSSIIATDFSNWEEVSAKLKAGDSVLITGYNGNAPSYFEGSKLGDVYYAKTVSSFENIGNIRGKQGFQGRDGQQGEQGIQGIQGVQGRDGADGQQGIQGPAGLAVRIHTGIKSNAGELPEFSSAEVGDAYRVQRISDGQLLYDLYFKTVDGETWDVQPNIGIGQGTQGVAGKDGKQGIQGVKGEQGEPGLDARNITKKALVLSVVDEYKTKFVYDISIPDESDGIHVKFVGGAGVLMNKNEEFPQPTLYIDEISEFSIEFDDVTFEFVLSYTTLEYNSTDKKYYKIEHARMLDFDLAPDSLYITGDDKHQISDTACNIYAIVNTWTETNAERE